jgi:cell division protease FtsH
LDIDTLPGLTSGMVGADLANLINEAALLAVRRGKIISFFQVKS